MKYFLLVIVTILCYRAYAQPVVCPHQPRLVVYNTAGDTIPNGGVDTVQCGTTCVTMHATIDSDDILGTTTYTVASIAYAPQSFTAGSNVTYMGAIMATSGSTDDEFGDIISLPFNFCFFGASYNQIVVGSNGNATFNSSLANSYDPWPISGPLPGSNCSATENCIMAPWNDLEDFAMPGASVVYNVYGVAPCRQFVVSWNNDALFTPGTCTGYSTQQFILYESSNIIDIYIQHRAPCTAWNNGYAVTGIENNAGTLFYTPPGENGTTFTATNEGWRFTPATPINWNYTWEDSTGAVVGTADSVVLCPTVNTSRYSVSATDPANCLVLNSNFSIHKDFGIGIDSTAFTNPTSCIAYDGRIVFHGMPPGDTIYLSYIYDGAPSGTLVRYPDLDSDIVFTGLPSGTYVDFLFKHDSCSFGPYNFTLVAPPIVISRETSVNPTICGESNGSFTLYGLLPGQPVTVNYTAAYAFPAHTATVTYTGTVGADSTVTISGLPAGVYSGIVVAIGSCSTTGTSITIVNPAPVPAHFTFTETLHCNGDEVSVTNTSTPEPEYTAFFTFGDGTPVDSSNAIPLPHIYGDGLYDTGTYVITLKYEGYDNPACAATTTATVVFNHQISDSFSTNVNAVCLGTPIQFTGYTVSINNPTYTWSFGDGSSPVTSPGATASYTYPIAGQWKATLTVTDSIGCDTTYTDTLDVINIAVHTSAHDTTVCLVDSMPLIATSEVTFNWVGWNYSWMPTNNIGLDSAYTIPGVNSSTSVTNFFGVGTFIYTVTVTTTSPVLLLNPNGCFDTATETIISNPPVTLTNVSASPQTIGVGGSIYLNASGAVYYTWVPDNGTLNDPNINNPLATPVDSITIYTVYGMNQWGCKDSASVIVKVDNTTYQGAPSAFTPNGDGLNDLFKITPLKNQSLVEMRIYNRWGQPVYYTNNPETGWDGTYNGVPQDMGVYSYEIIVALPGGSNQVYKGTVTLIR